MIYEGERKKESMIDFAVKASGPVVGLIEDVQELSQVFAITSSFSVVVIWFLAA